MHHALSTSQQICILQSRLASASMTFASRLLQLERYLESESITSMFQLSSDRIFLFSILHKQILTVSKISMINIYIHASYALTEFWFSLNVSWYQFIICTKLNIKLFKLTIIVILLQMAEKKCNFLYQFAAI